MKSVQCILICHHFHPKINIKSTANSNNSKIKDYLSVPFPMIPERTNRGEVKDNNLPCCHLKTL